MEHCKASAQSSKEDGPPNEPAPTCCQAILPLQRRTHSGGWHCHDRTQNNHSQSLHKVYIDIVHKKHPSAEATKRRARNIILWPTMTKDISEALLSCAACNSTKSHQQKEPPQLHHVPDLPWSTVTTDIFKWRGKHYQMVVDSYSGWYDRPPP